MKFERIAYTAIAALLATACSGGDEQAAQTTVPVVDVATTAAPIVITTTAAPIETTAAPTTTTAGAQAPETLAFASTRDLGRLFEIDGQQNLYLTPAGDIDGSAADGTLVQATSARSNDGSLWVRVRATEGEFATLGWVAADTLRPTTRSVEISNNERSGEFRGAARALPNDQLEIVTEPSGSNVVGVFTEREIGLHGGTLTLGADGSTWVDVIDINTRARTGWVPSSYFVPVSSIQAQNDDGVDVRRRVNNEMTYGAPLSAGSTNVGCNAVQIRFASSSSTVGTAIVFGEEAPVGRESGSKVVWSATRGSTVYIEPGESVTFTFPTEFARTWHFAALDADFQAETANASFATQDELVASNVQAFPIERGSCIVEQAVVEENGDVDGIDPYLYSLPSDERDEALETLQEEEAAEAAAIAAEEAAAEAAAAAEQAAEEAATEEEPAADEPVEGE